MEWMDCALVAEHLLCMLKVQVQFPTSPAKRKVVGDLIDFYLRFGELLPGTTWSPRNRKQ